MPADQWRREVITVAVERVLRELRQASILTHFYLGGGTGLALRLGHRRSVDLDFFSDHLFDQEMLVQKARRLSWEEVKEFFTREAPRMLELSGPGESGPGG